MAPCYLYLIAWSYILAEDRAHDAHPVTDHVFSKHRQYPDWFVFHNVWWRKNEVSRPKQFPAPIAFKASPVLHELFFQNLIQSS